MLYATLMRAYFKLILTILILLVCYQSQAGIGLGDWICTTPGKNEINNFSGPTLYLQNGEQLEGLNNWFFYRSNVIGQLYNNKYFVVNETSFRIDTFRTKEEWLNFRRKNNLNPKVWTRWFGTDWQSPFDDLGFYLFMTFYISIPLILLFLWLCYKAIRHEKFNIRKPYTVIVTLIITIVLINYLLGQFPQSI